MPLGRHARAEPVFLDRSGRRRRLIRMVGAGLAVGLLASLGVILVGLLGGGALHVPGLPDPGQPAAGAGVAVTPAPTVEASGTELTMPGTPTSTQSSTTVTPTASATLPGRRHTPTAAPSRPRPTRTK